MHSQGHDLTAVLSHSGIAHMTGILPWMGMSFLETRDMSEKQGGGVSIYMTEELECIKLYPGTN